MSRAITILFGLVLGLATAVAPTAIAAGGLLSYGVKAGLAAATLNGDLPTDPFFGHEKRLGFGGGAAFTFGLGGVFALQPEILYVTKGTSLGDVIITDWNGNPVGTAKVIQSCDYVEVPVLVRYSAPTGGGFAPFFLAGPVVGILASQKIHQTGMDGGLFLLDVARSTDVGVALGVGAEIGHGRVRASVESRYTLGLTPATDSSYSDNARNSAVLIMAGLAIHP